jgi:hypothetical protein
LIASDSCGRNAALFVWGSAPILYYYSELQPATRFSVMAQSGLTGYISGNLESNRGQIATEQYIRQKNWDWLMQDLKKNPPAYIIDTAPAGIYRWNRYPIKNYSMLDGYLKESFVLWKSVEDVDIYRKKECGKH